MKDGLPAQADRLSHQVATVFENLEAGASIERKSPFTFLVRGERGSENDFEFTRRQLSFFCRKEASLA